MFGERLRELRKERNLTMKELGEKFSLAPSTISGYEIGNRKPDMEILQRLADFFDVSVDYLLGRTDKPNNINEDSSISVAFSHGGENLSDDEKEHLETELKRYREIKARFMKEKNRDN